MFLDRMNLLLKMVMQIPVSIQMEDNILGIIILIEIILILIKIIIVTIISLPSLSNNFKLITIILYIIIFNKNNNFMKIHLESNQSKSKIK